MKLHGIYSEAIAHLSEEVREEIIREAPHTQIVGEIPPGLGVLDGSFIDLGFENLGLSSVDKRAVNLAFVGRGVAMPGTGYKLRYTQTGMTAIEPDDGVLVLPEHWMDAILVLRGNQILYAGKLVRKEQLGTG